MARQQMPDWAPLLGQVLGLGADDARAKAQALSFTALGGTSLQAIALVTLGQRHLALDADVAAVMGTGPLATALATAGPYTRSAPAAVDPSSVPVHRPPLPGQKSMIAAHLLGRDRPYQLMFTLEADGGLDPECTRSALRELTDRHESLRTMFSADSADRARIVLPAPHEPRLLRHTLPAGADAVAELHAHFGRFAGELLRPFESVPAVFVLTDQDRRSLLTLLVHHTLMDGWSIGVFWREFAEAYHGQLADGPGPSPEWIATRLASVERSGAAAAATERVRARLDGAPQRLTLPTDLPPAADADGVGARLVFQLEPETAAGVERLARQCRATVTSVVLAAWALAVSRRAGQDDVLLGVPASGRFEAGMEQILGLCSRVVPLRCRTSGGADGGIDGAGYVRSVAAALGDAVADADLTYEQVVRAVGAEIPEGRNPLAQFGFAAHHELVPAALETESGRWRVHEGHCLGSVFDAMLFLQAWSEQPRLALEFATAMVSLADAGELAESFRAVLAELVRQPGSALDSLTGLSAGQRERLREFGSGGSFETTDDLWSAFARRAGQTPDHPAVVDGDLTLTYRQLHERALAQAGLLRAQGVGAGDRVVLELPRSAAETVAVLGVLRLGAAYVAVDETATADWRAHLARAVAPKARIGLTAPDPVWSGIADCPPATGTDDGGVDSSGTDNAATPLPEHRPAPADTAYISFTSGSTGVPKGVVVPHRAVLRLAADTRMTRAAGELRMLRLAPLAFDASTLELLVPLVAGGCVVVHPAGTVTPSVLIAFLGDAAVTHAWLTAGFFHLVADNRPDGFRGLRQLFTGGGVVSPAHVRRVLAECPGLRVTNGYGPTENTTFTTTLHVDGVDAVQDPLPIGVPVLGTDVHVVDPLGRPVPPGAVGELWASGSGLAHGYLNDPDRTAQSFTSRPETSQPETGRPVYRTGDLVRWGTDGRLRFLGRNDRQVKIAGHRVELVDVERRIRDRDGVLDVVVFLAGEGALGGLLCAAVKAEPAGVDLELLRAGVETGLAPYARPQRWFTLAEFPLDRNGKTDLRALAALAATAAGPVTPPEPEPEAPAGLRPVPLTELEDLVARSWAEALGNQDFDLDEGFFDVGGDSFRIAVVRNRLREELGGHEVPLTDFYRFPTVQSLAGHLHTRLAGVKA